MRSADFNKLVRNLAPGDALLVVPPFGGIDRPSFAAHLLQACAKQLRINVSVLYANLSFASVIGSERYSSVCYGSTRHLLGERIFSPAAYGTNGIFTNTNEISDYSRASSINDLNLDEIREIQLVASTWVAELAKAIASESKFRVIGCSTTFEQTAASCAILNQLKSENPSIISIIGGANCEGEMSRGIESLQQAIDFIFSGESEGTFPAFLSNLRSGIVPPSKIIQGKPCLDLDALPLPNYDEYFEQLSHIFPEFDRSGIWLPYECSRGCWWGEKRHCTFCGINGQTMTFREKKPDKVIEELRKLARDHKTTQICMVDNIMPHSYFRTFLPALQESEPKLHIFFEQKANLRLEQVLSLKGAGIEVIQPGIEALNSRLLRLMDKGVTAKQNIALLRYARCADLAVSWNLLYGFPGDQLVDYEQTIRCLPYLRHLHPPTSLFRLSIDRFSPYFGNPEKYRVRQITPLAAYYEVLPPGCDVTKVAYHFTAVYPSESIESPSEIAKLRKCVNDWKDCWQTADAQPPTLKVIRMGTGSFALFDTRGIPEGEVFSLLDLRQAVTILCGSEAGPVAKEDREWALENGLALEVDGSFVPLATADADVWLSLLVPHQPSVLANIVDQEIATASDARPLRRHHLTIATESAREPS